jgi:membrane protein
MRKRISALLGLLREAGLEFLEDRGPRLGAALAYYTTFSLSPLLLLVVALAGLVFGRQAAQGQLIQQIQTLVGEQGGAIIQTMLASAARPQAGILATIVSVVALLFGAAGVFSQLQDALNTVWEVQPKPGRGLAGMIRDRFLSFTMVLGTAFLLLVSLVVSTLLVALTRYLGADAGLIGHLVNFAASFLVITLLFAMIYRFLPDARIAWSDVWLGAAITSLLFALGKLLIGLYLGASAVASTYGAAGSLAVLLIWLYYSAQIFLFGAELTKAYADRYGSRIEPTANAERVTSKTRAEQGMPRRRRIRLRNN